jgi:hypothetical protein
MTKQQVGIYASTVLVAALILSMVIGIIVISDVKASKGKGLKVYLTVNSDFPSQQASIGTYQSGDNVDERYGFVNLGTTEITLNYQMGQVENGPFQICIRLNDEVQECGKGFDSEEKKPEYVIVNLHGGDPTPMPSKGNSQAQSSSNNNNNENENSLSQSQATTIIICNDGKCKPAQ